MALIPRYKLWLFYGLTATSGIVASASMYMRKMVEEKIFDQDICRVCIDLLQRDQKSLDVLGPPVTFKRPTMRNTFNNFSDTKASIALQVFGTKTAGNLLIVASKQEKDTEWVLKSLILEVPGQKIAIKQ